MENISSEKDEKKLTENCKVIKNHLKALRLQFHLVREEEGRGKDRGRGHTNYGQCIMAIKKFFCLPKLCANGETKQAEKRPSQRTKGNGRDEGREAQREEQVGEGQRS